MGLITRERFQRWHPDTCNCLIMQKWIDVQDEDTKEYISHTHVEDEIKMERDCGAHGVFRGHQKHCEEVTAENMHKNAACHALEMDHGIKPVEVGFSYTTARELVLDLGDIANTRKGILAKSFGKLQRKVIIK
jgi:hypothetical protein